MNSFTRLALLLCLTVATSVVSYAARAATINEQTSARLDALEKENAALRARVNRLEAPKAAKYSTLRSWKPIQPSPRHHDRKTPIPWPPTLSKPSASRY